MKSNQYFNVKSSGVTPSGIAYQRPLYTGSYGILRIGDDGWNTINRPYPSPPANPIYIQELDISVGGNYWKTLKHPNVFGNTSRFTDLSGVDTNGSVDGAIIDHLTGLMWKYTKDSGNWDTVIDASQSSTHLGYTDWKVPNAQELSTLYIHNPYGTAFIVIQNYLQGPKTELLHTSTTRNDFLTYNVKGIYTSYLPTSDKAISTSTYFCRNHF